MSLKQWDFSGKHGLRAKKSLIKMQLSSSQKSKSGFPEDKSLDCELGYTNISQIEVMKGGKNLIQVLITKTLCLFFFSRIMHPLGSQASQERLSNHWHPNLFEFCSSWELRIFSIFQP